MYTTPKDSLPPQATVALTVFVTGSIQSALSKIILSGDHSTTTPHILLGCSKTWDSFNVNSDAF